MCSLNHLNSQSPDFHELAAKMAIDFKIYVIDGQDDDYWDDCKRLNDALSDYGSVDEAFAALTGK